MKEFSDLNSAAPNSESKSSPSKLDGRAAKYAGGQSVELNEYNS